MTFKPGWPAFPDPARAEIAHVRRVLGGRYEELWDCGDERDEAMDEAAWVGAHPSRPADHELLNRDTQLSPQ